MIKRYTCQNGVRVVLENNPTVRSVAIGVWIGTGSRHETPEINGISHFLEHMFFKGTSTRSAREIAESFDRIGGQVNAFTSKEYTCYYAKVLDEHANYALDVLADMFFHSTFDENELKKEKNVVYEEIKMYEDAPDDIVHDLLSKATYGNHSLGYPILGTEETLASFNGDSLRQYMHDYYTPDRVVISVAGNISDSFIKDVEKWFGSYEAKGKATGLEKPEFYTEKLTRKKETEQAHLCLGFKGLEVGHERIYDLIVLNNVLGGSMSSRLFQDVREDKGLAYSVYSYHSSYEDSGMLTIYGGTGANQLQQLSETIQETLATLKRDGITSKELENSKEQMKGSLMLSLESTNSKMSRNGKNELLLGKHKTLDEIINELNAVNLERVNGLARQLFTDDYALALISPSGNMPS
ncbi:insulinase family protein [Bacillus inaquosorum]|uniref:Specific processing protease n=4 Tax=Bacillus inaquosorum TaxID=483913 RepID=A0A9W5LIS6_9BACI|nr:MULTISPECIES: pitrilysin family protein [Bacillus]MCY7781729.1 insulinase family protein [Bacillus sp. S20C3]MCY8202869.1 insulinase family protein [Bacillus sp. N12A5]MCY8287892.1 insulinase family protein [Bacillus sp. N13C7]MCY8640001.1 insulinase family protein [Bacillus sp. S17B2]MCY8718352.1 insulinase family protein [Bacillus sp. S10C12M]MCY9143031.1 insulinase family protein [Bacillus sp. T9C1]MDZ5720322.1 pitrilysin family protein [Bacillus sp. SXabc123]PSI06294.1 insulinase fam